MSNTKKVKKKLNTRYKYTLQVILEFLQIRGKGVKYCNMQDFSDFCMHWMKENDLMEFQQFVGSYCNGVKSTVNGGDLYKSKSTTLGKIYIAREQEIKEKGFSHLSLEDDDDGEYRDY